MGHCLFMRKGETHTAPISGILLSDIAEGSIVKLNESGSPVEFYVAKHDYESALNGEGRTLLVRKDIYGQVVWNSSNVNTYADSDIDAWLNGDYKALLDSNAQSAIGMTKFYYTPGNGNNNVTTLSRAVFQLSLKEIYNDGLPIYVNAEGSTLPIYSILQIAYDKSGSAVAQWTRSPRVDEYTVFALCLNVNGKMNTPYCTSTSGSRPCFTLPSTAVFDETTMLLKGVA